VLISVNYQFVLKKWIKVKKKEQKSSGAPENPFAAAAAMAKQKNFRSRIDLPVQ